VTGPPSPPAEGTELSTRAPAGTGRRTSRSSDATTLLSIYLVLLLAIPSKLIFAPLGGAGTPAQILGMAAGVWWGWNRLSLSEDQQAPAQPVRRAMVVFLAVTIVSFVAATLRPIEDNELRAAQMGLLSVLAWSGIVLLANDGFLNRDRLELLLSRLAVGAGLLAALGIMQFITRYPFVNLIQIPGLTANTAILSVASRDGFARPAGTALHPIEFGVALTMLLPLALHRALYPHGHGLARRWFPVVAISAAVPISISRSAIVGAVVVLALLVPTWSRAMRKGAFGFICVLLVVVFVTVPGLLGTITGLFTGVGNDSSAQSRTGSYALAWSFISRAPIFGRGFGTFLPRYRIFDNQYLGLLIEAGVVGLTALLALFATGIALSRRVRRRSTDPETRDLAQSLVAGLAAGACSFALFDALAFPIVAGLMFLLLGLAGGLAKLQPKGSPRAAGDG